MKKDLPVYKRLKHPVFEVIKILGRKVQSDYIARQLVEGYVSVLDPFSPPFMFPAGTILTPEGKTYLELIKKVNVEKLT
ncbi:hypothetical protein CHI08_13290 [Peribacillus simplex]|nr:hypothetical protein CHI08_13290 [Peribacillus simplex]